MLKMMIRMDDDKITTEKKYHLDGIYSTINNTFLTMGPVSYTHLTLPTIRLV